jgi:hypothetical protein
MEYLEMLYEEIKDIVQSITINSPDTYYFRNHLYKTGYSTETESSHYQEYTELSLQDLLYRVYHCRNDFYLKGHYRYISSEYNDIQDFTGNLSIVNSGKGTWEKGWEIVKFEKDGQIAVRKNGLTLWVFPKFFKSDKDIPLSIGLLGKIKVGHEYRKLLPGFYMAIGDAEASDIKNTTVRIYWNIKSGYATLLMRLLTKELNTKSIPFRFKVLNNPSSYPRADAGVLYIDKEYYKSSKPSISNIYLHIVDGLSSSTPLFAKRLAPGLSLAEDPNNNESFGQHRCRILAEALHTINKNNLSSDEQSILEIKSYFNNLKIDLNHSYLNPGSTDDYELLIPI